MKRIFVITLFLVTTVLCNEQTVIVRNLHFSKLIRVVSGAESWTINPMQECAIPSKPFEAAILGSDQSISVDPQSVATLITIASLRSATYIFQSKNYIPFFPLN